jgi:hypothetical protein
VDTPDRGVLYESGDIVSDGWWKAIGANLRNREIPDLFEYSESSESIMRNKAGIDMRTSERIRINALSFYAFVSFANNDKNIVDADIDNFSFDDVCVEIANNVFGVTTESTKIGLTWWESALAREDRTKPPYLENCYSKLFNDGDFSDFIKNMKNKNTRGAAIPDSYENYYAINAGMSKKVYDRIIDNIHTGTFVKNLISVNNKLYYAYPAMLPKSKTYPGLVISLSGLSAETFEYESTQYIGVDIRSLVRKSWWGVE